MVRAFAAAASAGTSVAFAISIGVALAGAGAAASDEPAAAARGPAIGQLVVFDGGKAIEKRVRAAAVAAKVGRRRCAIAARTPLAALLRSRVGRVGLEDFGSCTSRARDSGQVYVRSIRADRERGASGWVYKVGRRLGTAGAADPTGSFGRGRLRRGARVTWFYCTLRGGSCQRTLGVIAASTGGGTVAVRVRGYDDEGRGRPVEGATVATRGASTTTDASGRATLALAPGTHTLRAAKAGFVRSFGERVTVR